MGVSETGKPFLMVRNGRFSSKVGNGNGNAWGLERGGNGLEMTVSCDCYLCTSSGKIEGVHC